MRDTRANTEPAAWPGLRVTFIAATVLLASVTAARAEDLPDYRADIEPLLTELCFECHGFGSKEGNVAFDELTTDDDLLRKPELWNKALRNLRAGVMPPAGKPRPSAEQQAQIAKWIKFKALGIDPENLDPGQVALRRLNRTEYRNTIRDLMGIDFNTTEEFPADDTGYGFDTVADVLSVSPLLLEKYLQAAETIVARAAPTAPRAVREERIPGDEFRGGEGDKQRATHLAFYSPTKVSNTFIAEEEGAYLVIVNLAVEGDFHFDPGRCRLVFSADGEEKLSEEYQWGDGVKYTPQFNVHWKPGRHELTIELEPLTDPERKVKDVDQELEIQVATVTVRGPLEKEKWKATKNYDLFFTRPEPPVAAGDRREYAREVLSGFLRRAFRQPTDAALVERLTGIAEAVYGQPDKRFEEGIARAIVAALATPRFLFRLEDVEPGHEHEPSAPIDEYALASRLSYFLWSSMPDDELLDLAERGELRKNLASQAGRMLKDRKSAALVENFVGQWLQVRDVEGISINERAVLALEDEELQKLIELLRLAENDEERRAVSQRLGAMKRPELTGELRKAMRRESEMCFDHVVHEDRSVLELLDSNYTFLNEKLARHYGMDEVSGPQMRLVKLPGDSPRGGVLTQGAVLVVTSNPSRTSPVKRGLFILDSILGMPTPPPLPDAPVLEESEKQFQDHKPTGRELLEVHRDKPQCASCHARMDPLGLGFEHFNAMGMWREKERGQAIDSAGQLMTGEKFENVRELKRILVEQYRPVYYRCLTEKLFTYALGRGLSYHDTQSVDIIVDRLESQGGRFSALLMGIIESVPFQQRRNIAVAAADEQVQRDGSGSKQQTEQ